ncbi:MAG: hypothetical protein LBB18_03520 [Puniceicoccales bacterium]|jgi:hypothetical protein|nr:hypothetical protein [Puniceicoccales bacterium]
MVIPVENRVVVAISKDGFLPVVQFSLMLDTRVLMFNSVLKSLHRDGVSILAVSFLENFETATIRCIVNYPDIARKVFSEKMVLYHEANVMAVEMNGVDELPNVFNAISAAEMRVHYMYPFLARPGGKIGLIMQTENNEFTANILTRIGIRTISQNDVGR